MEMVLAGRYSGIPYKHPIQARPVCLWYGIDEVSGL